MTKNDEYGFPGIQAQGHGRAAVRGLIGGRVNSASIGVPDFRFHSIDAKDGLQFFGPIIAIVYVIEVSAGELAMNEEELRIWFRLAVLKISRNFIRGKNLTD